MIEPRVAANEGLGLFPAVFDKALNVIDRVLPVGVDLNGMAEAEMSGMNKSGFYRGTFTAVITVFEYPYRGMRL